MLVSEYLHLDKELQKHGVFDAQIDKDSHFFINIVRVKHSDVREFKDAYESINKRFSDIATLLAAAQLPTKSDKMFRSAYKQFNFPEINGINLGFAKSTHGSGLGDVLSMQILDDAYQIVKAGSTQPEIFHLVSLFEENIGPDRLSDMIASIIEPNIRRYTLRILDELRIDNDTHPEFDFYNDGLIKNPYKSCPLLLVPIDILHELPIAKYWGDIDDVIEKNQTIRREINTEIGEMWTKWNSAERKSYIKHHVFMNPEACARVIKGYRSEKAPTFDPTKDADYFSEVLFGELKRSASFDAASKTVNSFDGALAVIDIFKDWVENNRGWEILQHSSSTNREKTVQRLLHLCAKHYVDINKLDISFEPNAGRGPVDVKLSRGSDRTIIEIKLSTNPQCLHGYKIQVEEYAKGEGTSNRVYVIVDLGNPSRVASVIKQHKDDIADGISCPELIIVNAREKKPASVYEPDSDIEL